MADFMENTIEWLTNFDRVTVTFTQKKYINKIKKLAAEHPEVEIVAENKDGSLCAHLPLKFIRISAPRKVSEENIENFKKMQNRFKTRPHVNDSESTEEDE